MAARRGWWWRNTAASRIDFTEAVRDNASRVVGGALVGRCAVAGKPRRIDGHAVAIRGFWGTAAGGTSGTDRNFCNAALDFNLVCDRIFVSCVFDLREHVCAYGGAKSGG